MAKITIVDNGITRYAGCKPRRTKLGQRFSIASGPGGLFPEPMTDAELAEYADISLESYCEPELVINQGRQGTCDACATAGAIQICRNVAGLTKISLSQATAYAFDDVDEDGTEILRRSDNGQSIDEGLEIACVIGYCPTDVIDPMDWEGLRAGRWPPNWREIAKRYRIIRDETWDCRGARDMWTGIALGYCGVYGLRSHAVVLVSQKNSLNSWGKNWPTEGANGIGPWAKSFDDLDNGIKQYGGWLIRATVDPTGDGDIPTPTETAA